MWGSDALELQPFVSVCERHKKRERKGKAGEESLKEYFSIYSNSEGCSANIATEMLDEQFKISKKQMH